MEVYIPSMGGGVGTGQDLIASAREKCTKTGQNFVTTVKLFA